MVFMAQDWITIHAKRRHSAPALACAEDGRSLNWAQLDDRTGRLATHNAAERVARGPGRAHRDPRVFEVRFAAMRLSSQFVQLNWRLSRYEMADICLDCRPTVVLHDADWAATAARSHKRPHVQDTKGREQHAWEAAARKADSL